jgi:two-component system chemotaxis response regulator CheY
MIIDDANLVRLYYRDIIERAGYAVEEALNGLEALEKLLITPADFLIVDVNMPKMDGLTFLKTLRQQAAPLAGIPALVTSSEAEPQDRLAARVAGANYYLVKPIAPDRLLDHIRLLCGAP